MKHLLSLAFTALLVTGLPGTDRAPDNSPLSLSLHSDAAARMQHKLQYLQTNGAAPHPNPAPTEFTEQEINAYVASGSVKLPSGVHSVTFQGEPGMITANSQVDFDQLKAGRSSYNPLLSVFSGLHDVVVAAHAHGAGSKGFVHVDSVSLDGMVIPQFVLELFVQKYLQPRYPGIGLDSQFALPDRVDTATVEAHKVIVTQR